MAQFIVKVSRIQWALRGFEDVGGKPTWYPVYSEPGSRLQPVKSEEYWCSCWA